LLENKKYFMKKIIIAFFTLSLICTFEGYSQSTEKIKWYSFEEAVILNKENPKKVFIDVYTDWCGWCKTLDKNTFSNPVIIKLMNQYFYAVKLNAERKDTVVYNGYSFVNPNPTGYRSAHQLASSLLKGQMGYPSMVFLDEKMSLITLIQSYLSPNDLEPALNWIGSDKYLDNTIDYETFRKSFVSSIPAVTPTTTTISNESTTNSFILDKVVFDIGSAVINKTSNAQLDSVASILSANATMKIEIAGYTDNTGSEDANKLLSAKRAKAVYGYFLMKGIKASAMSYTGYGSLNPIADNNTEAGKIKNRRVEIKIISK
jgi:outer membrane protein OmpA-like peptidoglycan-associated protein